MCSHSCFGFKEVSDFRMPGPVKNRLYADPSLLCSLPTSSVLTDRTKQCSFGSCTAPPTGTIPAKSKNQNPIVSWGCPNQFLAFSDFAKLKFWIWGFSWQANIPKIEIGPSISTRLFDFWVWDFARKNCLWLRVCLARLPTRGLCEAFRPNANHGGYFLMFSRYSAKRLSERERERESERERAREREREREKEGESWRPSGSELPDAMALRGGA